MSNTSKIVVTHEPERADEKGKKAYVLTLADLRAFVDECEAQGLPLDQLVPHFAVNRVDRAFAMTTVEVACEVHRLINMKVEFS